MYLIKLQNHEAKIRTERRMNEYIITIGDFNTSLSVIDKTPRQHINTNTEDFNNIMN